MANPKYLIVENVSEKDAQRIFSKVSINLVTGCWEWIAALNTYGYGCIWWKGRQEQAHRLLYAWFVGPIPQGIAADVPGLDHIVCNNPRCCNPDHLRLATTLENCRRSNSVSAVNRRKTHCKYGHPLPDKPNRKSGYGRFCPVCKKIQGRATYLRRKLLPVHEIDKAKQREYARLKRESAH